MISLVCRVLLDLGRVCGSVCHFGIGTICIPLMFFFLWLPRFNTMCVLDEPLADRIYGWYETYDLNRLRYLLLSAL